MHKVLAFLVLLIVATVALAAPTEEVQDQQTAEQFFATYGYYPSWYTGFRTYVSSANVPASTYKVAAAPVAATYKYVAAPPAFPYAYHAAYPYGYGYNYVY